MKYYKDSEYYKDSDMRFFVSQYVLHCGLSSETWLLLWKHWLCFRLFIRYTYS